ncbi:MAG: glycosyltransferase [Bacilli bacterium]|nr:glycosyltransferase [Bacilli bacterium]
MKILQVIGVLNKGGAETLLMNIFENIDREKYEFDFLVFEDREYPYTKKVLEMGGNIIYMPDPKKVGMFNFIQEFKKLCKKNKYEVVHAHTLFNCGPCMLGAYLAGVKVRSSRWHSTCILWTSPSPRETQVRRRPS